MSDGGDWIKIGDISKSEGIAVGTHSTATVNKPGRDLHVHNCGTPFQWLFAGVPARGPKLVGREQILTALRARLIAGETTAIQGIPGVGKTSLALALAYDEQTREHFTGGVLWAALGPQANVASILDLWSEHLGVDLSAVPTITERAQRLNVHLHRALGGRPFLLVLDDAWRWEDVAPLRAFTGRDIAVLVTTRDASLAADFAGVSVFTVPELHEGMAVCLLTEAAPQAAEANPDGARKLAQAVGGLPLALILMAAELRRQGRQPRWIKRTVEHLRDAEMRLALVDRQARPGLPVGASPSLRAVIELSLEALPDAQLRSAFAKLGVFAPKPANFSRDAVLAVWEVGDEQGDAWLQILVQRGLLENAGEDRFTLHQVLADVAKDGLAVPEEVAQRHFTYYLQVLRRDRAVWDLVEAEFSQIRQAWAWALGTEGRQTAVLEFVWAAERYMQQRGLWTELLQWFEDGLSAARTLENRYEEGRLLGNIGRLQHSRGELAAALTACKASLAVWRALADPANTAQEATVLDNIGSIYWKWQQLDEALQYHQQALALRQRIGKAGDMAAALANIGTVQQSRGDYRDALRSYRQALALHQQASDPEGVATLLGNIGKVCWHWKDRQRALRYYEQALGLWRRLGDVAGEANVLNSVGMLHYERGELDEAEQCYNHVLAIHRKTGERQAEAATLNNLGMVHAARGAYIEALQCYEQALAIGKDVGEQSGGAAYLHNIGALYRRQGDLDAALHYFDQALIGVRKPSDRDHEVAILRNMATVYEQKGDSVGALRCYREAIAAGEEIAHPELANIKRRVNTLDGGPGS